MSSVFQPTLPAEAPLLQVERNFIANSPPGLWPDNQDSNFGQIRRVLCEQLQECADMLTTLYNQIFPDSADRYLELWEDMLQLPINPVGKSVTQRRAIVLSRMRYGAFTRDLRASVIEDMLTPTFGDPLRFSGDGFALDAGGLPLAGETLVVTQLYRVYEDIRNWKYQVRIDSTNAIDVPTLVRSLLRLTPAGMTFQVENTLSQILNYGEMMKDANPVALVRMGLSLSDESGFGNTVGVPSAPTALAAPGLVAGTVLGADGARDFNGTTNYITITENVVVPGVSLFTFAQDWTIEFIWQPKTRPAAGNARRIVSKGANSIEAYQFSDGALYVRKEGAGDVIANTNGTFVFANGTKYHVAITKRVGESGKVYVNGVNVTSGAGDPVLTPNVLDVNIGRLSTGEATSYLDAIVDEFAIYNYALPADKVLEHYRTSVGLP